MGDQDERVYSEYQNTGINRNVSPFLRLPGQWKRIINAHLDKVGVLGKRDGYSKILNTPDGSEILSLIPFEVGTVKRLIMINAAGKLYSANIGTDTTWGSPILTGLSTTRRWGWTVMSDSSGVKYMIIGNGATVKKTSDGVAFSDVSGAPAAKYWATLYQRVYAAGVDADPDTLFWCSIGDLTNWSGVDPSDSSSTPIDRYSKGNIKALIASNDRVVIYKEKVVKRWDSEYLLSALSSDGLAAPYSIAEVLGLVLTLGSDNIYLYDGSYPQVISLPIFDIVKNINRSSGNIERICAVGYKNVYYLSVGDVTTDDGDEITNCWIVYDALNNAFFIYSLAVQATAMCKFSNASNGVENLYFGDASGNVYQMFDTDEDDGANIEMLLNSHRLYPGGAGVAKEGKMVTVVADPATGLGVKLIGSDDRKASLGEATKHVSTFRVPSEMSEGNDFFELVITHTSKGKPKFYGFDIAVAGMGAERT